MFTEQSKAVEDLSCYTTALLISMLNLYADDDILYLYADDDMLYLYADDLTSMKV